MTEVIRLGSWTPTSKKNPLTSRVISAQHERNGQNTLCSGDESTGTEELKKKKPLQKRVKHASRYARPVIDAGLVKEDPKSDDTDQSDGDKKRDGMVKNWIDGKKRRVLLRRKCGRMSPRRQLNRRGSIFSDGNAPTAQQAMYYETGPDPSKSKRPPRVPIFEGVKINWGHGAFETVMSPHGK